MGRYTRIKICYWYYSQPYFPVEWTAILVNQTSRKVSQNRKHQNWYKKVIDLHVRVF